jgi:hypothetical protein
VFESFAPLFFLSFFQRLVEFLFRQIGDAGLIIITEATIKTSATNPT